ncbi:unnamed protein product [Phyllotreta striolata]|uniref:Uncharacterized protein n=1 Tax=Phyllotreta striolata TaxID=444603 RepID=A0A9N9TUV4_PHYSR|nr:unnamed protein product [Phyllotreta striolata]
MSDIDLSDGHGYDSDKDGEFIPHQETSNKTCRIQIRGRYYNVPRSSSSSSSSSENHNSILETDLRRKKPGCSVIKKLTINNNNRHDLKSKNLQMQYDASKDASSNLETDSSRSQPGCSMIRILGSPARKQDSVNNEIHIEEASEEEPRPQDSDSNHISENPQNPTTGPREDIIDETKKKLSRKRKNNTSEWACNIRKARFDRGLDYISSRKKAVPAREIKNTKDCIQKCLFKCSRKISDDQRKEIFKNYYLLSAAEKKNYILHTTEVDVPWRRRKGKNNENSKKSRTFRFYFELNGHKIQVCKAFYTGTLCISQKPIYTVHGNKTLTNTLRESKQGKHQKRVTSPEDSDFVKLHINMIPRVESHYCRKKSNKEYFESEMSIKKLYELYLEYAKDHEKTPVSFCVYRKIFCNSFNIAFHKPRKDRCDTCEEMKVKKQENTVDEKSERMHINHMKEKEYMREQKQKDKESGKPILCFDLENVLTCPKADIKNFFYKSKLNVYNMTGHLSVGKKVYCAIWTEALHGRTGNDMASAVYKILDKIMEDHPEFTEIILWSDSCVPQNRNSHMSYALSHLIQTHKNLQNITMKFSVPGHSCIQEVDAIHSSIERSLNKVEYYSPVSLLRFLLKVNRQKPYTVIQMKKQDFIDFQSYSSQLNYNTVPFSKIVSLQFSRNFYELKYKESFEPTGESEAYKTVNLHQRKLRKAHVTVETEPTIPLTLKKCDKIVALPQAKRHWWHPGKGQPTVKYWVAKHGSSYVLQKHASTLLHGKAEAKSTRATAL